MMIHRCFSLLPALYILVNGAPTWPASTDELEDIMFLQTGYNARGFAAPITPCGYSAQGPGRNSAAEFIRTAFHDAATGNVYQGTGGVDGSIQYELGNGDNAGDGFRQSLASYAPYFSTRAPISDLIAVGLWAGVRTCGGPLVPVRGGRIDATAAGPVGVPQPQNSQYTFEQQFLRIGYNTTGMIQVVACGHTVGGVHPSNFPQIVPAGSAPNDVVHFDASPSTFDEKVASAYVTSQSTDPDPLVNGPSVSSSRASDNTVFTADQGVTIKAMADPTTFANTCKAVLQQLIEVVPTGVTLTDPIAPYDVKPSNMQLILQGGGTNLLFTGAIRVRTTSQTPSTVTLKYKDRTGGTNCGSCTITTALKGMTSGFGETFSFYGFSATIPASSSISSFNVQVDSTSYTNNGKGFAVQDVVMLQQPQSCLAAADGSGNQALTVVAALILTEVERVTDIKQVRTTAVPSLTLTLQSAQAAPNPVPSLSNRTVTMTKLSTAGAYTLYQATSGLGAGQGNTTRFDISASGPVDSFKLSSSLGSVCQPFGSGTSSSSSSSTSSSTTTSSTLSTSVVSSTTSKPSSTSSKTTSTSSSAASGIGISYIGCFTEASGSRAFTGASSTNAKMTVELCASSCSSFQYFGVEYGDECYCGNTQASTSVRAPESDCSFACPGNSAEKCGAGNRLNVYQNLSYRPYQPPTIAGYTYLGCYNDSTSGRVLTGPSTAADDLSLESCGRFANGATYFGAEYGRECYTGASLASTSTKQPDSDCNMACSGKASEICGAGNRLSLYKKS